MSRARKKKTKEITFQQRTKEYIWINHIQKNSKGCPGSDNGKPKILRQGHDVQELKDCTARMLRIKAEKAWRGRQGSDPACQECIISIN